MIPYADFLYFAVLAIYVAVPTAVIRLVRGFSRVWILLATVFVLIIQYGDLFQAGPLSDAATSQAEPTPVTAPFVVPEIGRLAAFALFQYLLALCFLAARRGKAPRRVYYFSLGLGLAPLVLSRFVPLWRPETLIGFAGISYVTFRSLDVLFSIEDRLITSLPPGQYLAYILFFPTISSGPIDRYRRFAQDWQQRRDRAQFFVDLDGAVHRIFNGFLLKFILAAVVKRYWMDRVDPAEHGLGPWNTLSFMYAYSCYLFFDFAGYSYFAVGVSYLLGIRTPENFNRPYLARNIRDFWNRWHMTLTAWLRDHVFMRFLLAATKGKWFKNKQTPAYLGLILSFGLMGLWHGIEPFYLLYGLYHAALMAGYEAFSRWNKRRKLWGEGPLARLAGIALTLQLVCMGFLLFSGRLGPH